MKTEILEFKTIKDSNIRAYVDIYSEEEFAKKFDKNKSTLIAKTNIDIDKIMKVYRIKTEGNLIGLIVKDKFKWK